MEEPVELCSPRSAVSLVELFLEVFECVLLRPLHGERLAEILDVIERLQLRDAARQHHGEEGDKDVGVLTQAEVGLAAQLHEPATTSQR